MLQKDITGSKNLFKSPLQ